MIKQSWIKSSALFGAVLSLAGLVGCGQVLVAPEETSGWSELFDGQTLDGWTQVNGTAPYEVREGVLRGTNVLDSPNSFLATDDLYADFVLEFESRSIGEANSGVQFRTEGAPGTWSGVVGYQLDIDPSARRWTGGIYHEGVHLWRHAMARNPACQAAYMPEAWNNYRIEAVGPVMATWVNGVACAHMVGDHHDAGFIALQVHAIGQEEQSLGSFTEWRHIRLLENPKKTELWLSKRAELIEGWLEPEISDIERAAGWRPLDLSTGQARFEMGSGAVEVVIDLQLDAASDGHLNYAFTQAGDSCVGRYKLYNDVALGEGQPAAKLIGSFPGKYDAANLSEPGRPKRAYGMDRPNRVRILVTDTEIQHWLNGVKVVDYPRCEGSAAPLSPNQMQLTLVTEGGQIQTRSAKIRLTK